MQRGCVSAGATDASGTMPAGLCDSSTDKTVNEEPEPTSRSLNFLDLMAYSVLAVYRCRD